MGLAPTSMMLVRWEGARIWWSDSMAVLSLFHPGVKQKENECAGAYDCSFANGSRCGLIAPNDRMNRSNETRFYGDREMTKLRTAVTAAAMAALLTGTQAMAADGPLLAPGKPGFRSGARPSPQRSQPS